MGIFSCPSTTECPAPVRSFTFQPLLQEETHLAAFLRGTPTLRPNLDAQHPYFDIVIRLSFLLFKVHSYPLLLLVIHTS